MIALQAKQVIITTMTMCSSSSSSSIVGVHTNLKGFSHANLVGSYLCGGVLTASLLVGILLYNFFIKGSFQRLQYNLILRPADSVFLFALTVLFPDPQYGVRTAKEDLVKIIRNLSTLEI